MSLRATYVQSTTIASGDTLSGVLTISGLTDLVLQIPTIDSSSLFIRGGVNSGAETQLFATDGSGVFTVVAGTGSLMIRLSSVLDGCETVQIEAGAAQQDNRIFQLIGSPRI